MNRQYTSRVMSTGLVVALGLMGEKAVGATNIWTQTAGGAQAWGHGANWSGGVAPSPVSGDTVDFSTVNIGADTTLTLGADRTAAVWKFGDTSGGQRWTVNSGNSMILAGATPTVNVVQNRATLSNVVAGTAGLAKTGTGTLTLTATNTYSGATTVRAGTLLLDGGVVNNSSVLTLGPPSINSTSLVMTNGARFFAGGGNHYVGNRSSANTMTVVGGTATSTFSGGGWNTLYVCSARERTENNNRLTIGANGVVTNIGTLWVGDGGAYSRGNSFTNQLVVTDGGKLFAGASLYIGVISAGGNDNCSATYNTGLIANGGIVRAGGEVYVGALAPNKSNGNGAYNFNSLTITNGGQLYSGGPVSCIGWVRSTYTTAKANSNTVTIAGSLNGTNALWDLGGKALYVGYTTNASAAIGNVLRVNAGGVATNIGSLTVSANNTLELGAGGKLYANAVTNAGTMAVDLDNGEAAGACGLLTVTGELNVDAAVLSISVSGEPSGNYVIASYGALTGAGTFAETNGLPANCSLDMNYRFRGQIAIVSPPAGTVFITR